MPDYHVRFDVHLVSATLPANWPNPVIHDLIIRANDFEMLKATINQELLMFVKQQGVVILKDTNKPLEDNMSTMDLRQFIPMHMVAYVTTKTRQLAADVPDIEEGGTQLQ